MLLERHNDRYNTRKVWVIKRYDCGHYCVGQEIDGRQFGSFVRVPKSYVENLKLL